MKTKTSISENKLLKAMQELEDAVGDDDVEKADALEDADAEGGLSTEGEPLSSAAPRGRGESTKKSRRASSRSSSDTSSSGSSDDASSGGDGESMAEMMAAKKSKKKPGKKFVRKAAPASSSSDDDDDDDAGSDESSDDRSEAEKSFRQRAEEDETMRKGIKVNDFLEGMVDQLSLALYDVKKSMAKSIAAMEARLLAHIDESITKSIGYNQQFNARLAKAIAAIGNTVQGDLVDMVKSLSDQPVSPRGKAVLSKGEVNQPPWGGPRIVGADQRLANGADDYVTELSEVPRETIETWLFKKASNQQIDPNVILAWEADHYDLNTLPVQVRKALTADLIK